jgi:Fe-S oxidoreductase
MLDKAKATLERSMRVLAPQLEAGLPVVVLEPGCLSVFRDELKQLFPKDARASVLASRVISLPEFLGSGKLRFKSLEQKVLMHGHCHQKSLWGMAADVSVLRGAGCEVSAPDTGCCGMAGSFGYRPELYAASKRIAGLELLPALQAAPASLVVASGFSCREQIEGLARRKTLHIAELLARAL